MLILAEMPGTRLLHDPTVLLFVRRFAVRGGLWIVVSVAENATKSCMPEQSKRITPFVACRSEPSKQTPLHWLERNGRFHPPRANAAAI
jgi:hypothetical protein